MSLRCNFSLTHPDAKRPTQNVLFDAGYDLYAVEDIILPPGKVTKVNIHIIIELVFIDVLKNIFYGDTIHNISEDTNVMNDIYTQIHSRSGLASKGIFAVGGVIDLGYRGEIIVLLHNSTDAEYFVSKGDRVAQLIFHRITNSVKWVENVVSEYNFTERGDKGFGSSGL